MKFCIIGSGNVATHLAQALVEQHHSIEGIYSPHIEHAKVLAQKVHAAKFTDNISSLPQADCYVFSIKDACLAHTIEKAKQELHISNKLCIHTAGSGIEQTAVLYPMQSISKEKNLDFSKVPLFIEANNSATLQIITRLASQLSRSVTPLNSDKRKMLHLAAVFANNFTNHCCALAYKLLQENGINPQCLLPLFDETMLHTLTPQQAQTGPAIRWDENVINMQRQLLKSNNPEMLAIYDVMSKSIHHLHTLSAEET